VRTILQKHFNAIVKQEWICLVCGKKFRRFNDAGIVIDGEFATMHNECYFKSIENSDNEFKCIGGKVIND